MKEVDFSFGRNWRLFLKRFDAQRAAIAESSLLEFMEVEDLAGKSFLDIGCGSGLFSYAAHRLGASRVVSFDIDPECVACCRELRAKADNPGNWEIDHGSVLDEGFLSGLGSFDIVYSWGVLHHTGEMWRAIENSLSPVKPGGLHYIALYNRILARDGSTASVHSFWTTVKKIYNSHPLIGTCLLEPPAMAAYLAIVMARGENPVKHVRNYRSHRGMSWRTDATDWLGGYPYEFATVEEVFRFVRSKRPDFNLVNLKVTSGRGLNWYLFQRDHGPR
jgi:2-polyprenyl-6-hydroxyphenyl methylase/3-demethylubiquinone-9 3-methyltransferase